MKFLGPLALLMAAAPAAATPAKPAPGTVRVRFETSMGAIVLALDTRHAPATARNFLAYVDDRRFDDTTFYRVVQTRGAPTTGFIQGGIRTDARRILPPFPMETTAKTGIRHLDGTISMARHSDPGSAGGNYFITLGALPSMDARPDNPGYAAFGRVIGGMDVVRKIHARQTGVTTQGAKGQLLRQPVRVLTVRRLDGVAHPTGGVKPWLIETKPKR